MTLGVGRHVVHTPDLFDGERPPTIKDGFALAESIGRAELEDRANRTVADLAQDLVYAGSSFGAGVAQRLAQTT